MIEISELFNDRVSVFTLPEVKKHMLVIAKVKFIAKRGPNSNALKNNITMHPALGNIVTNYTIVIYASFNIQQGRYSAGE